MIFQIDSRSRWRSDLEMRQRQVADPWADYGEKLGTVNSAISKYFPKVFNLGPSRTALNWLYANLIESPDMCSKISGETLYFTTYWRWHTLEEYLGSFSRGTGKVRGDFGPGHGQLPSQVIQLLSQIQPDLKFIAIIRDPISRAWSLLKHSFRHAEANFRYRKCSDTVEEKAAIDAFKRVPTQYILENLIDDWSVVPNQWDRVFERWLRFFPANQFKVLFYDDVMLKPHSVIEEICDFIGIAKPVHKDDLAQKLSAPSMRVDIDPYYQTILKHFYRNDLLRLESVLEKNFSLKLPASWQEHLCPLDQVRKVPLVITSDLGQYEFYNGFCFGYGSSVIRARTLIEAEIALEQLAQEQRGLRSAEEHVIDIGGPELEDYTLKILHDRETGYMTNVTTRFPPDISSYRQFFD